MLRICGLLVVGLFVQGCATTNVVDPFAVGTESGAALKNGGGGSLFGETLVTQFVQFNDISLNHGYLIAGKDAEFRIPAGYTAVDIRVNYLSHAVTGILKYGHGGFAFDAKEGATYSLRAQPSETGGRVWLLENDNEIGGPLHVDWTTERFVEQMPALNVEPSGATDTGRTAQCHELLGHWKMVPLRDDSINEVDPWPLPHQWFAFYPDGRFRSMMSTRDRPASRWALEALFSEVGSDGPRYGCEEGWLMVSHPDQEGVEVWGMNLILTHAREETKLSFVPGDIVLTLAAPDDGRMIYFRHLRRVARSSPEIE